MTHRRLLALPLAALLALGLAGPSLAQPPEELPPVPPAASDTGQAASAEGRGHLHSHGPDGLDLDRGRRPGATVVAEAVDQTLTTSWTVDSDLKVWSSDQPDRFQGLPQVHLVYLYGSEVKTPRTKFLSMFQADARAVQEFLLGRYGRSVRFDETAGGKIDITTVKSRYRTSQLGGSRQFDLVKEELKRVFPDSDSPRKKYIAWLDAPSSYCGQGELYGDWHRDRDNWNDLRTTGVVYRPYSASGADGGWCRGRTLLHELGHNLGAIYGKAPNAFDGSHCDDDKNDAMCYQGSVTSGFDSGATNGSKGEFDWGNDDYWDKGAVVGSANGDYFRHLNWWGVNLSRFVCRPEEQKSWNESTGTFDTVIKAANCAINVEVSAAEWRYRSGDTGVPSSQPTAEPAPVG